MTGTWYPPSLGTGGVLIEAQLFTNPPFKMTEHYPTGRSGHEPTPDDRGVLPMIVSETGADDEPELERIICASISGGADYVNSMPRELRLERITPEGSTFARYIQVDADARPDVRPAPAPAGEVAELVEGLRLISDGMDAIGHESDSWFVARAADLLERQAAPVPVLPDDAQVIEPTERTIMVPLQTPVPISERLPGPEDCDAEGKCWMGYWDSHVNGLGHSHKTWFWTLEDLSMVDEHTHWLPHHALPKPSGEVES